MSQKSTGKAGIGVTMQVGDGASPEVFTTVANVTTMSVGGVTLNTIDATHLNSPNFYQEFIAGLKSADEWTFTMQWDPTDPTQSGTTGLRAKLEARELVTFRINTQAIGLPISLEADAFVSQLGNIDISPEAIMTQQCTIRPSGAPREVDN
ncbi:hypothetical protein GR212_15335 [Rhizobium lusitanum]|uniref:Lambda phage tail tube protein N-terminal domain-containing protein n=1 Tax=Rhizobium lusitanum TaxID=293958 RepID=A0A6L9U9I8_9HYPH|nr:phage tail tube protein [Rhizobium lusitanum]NEI70956.1 hypothetical protein [Rhizobium lusitanum]